MVACASASHAGRPISDRACRTYVAAVADTTIDYHADPGAGPEHTARTGPRYPDALRELNVQGRTVVSFTIDTAGYVIRNTARIESTSHPDFGTAICDWLPHIRYEPIRRRGAPVVADLRNMLITFGLMPSAQANER